MMNVRPLSNSLKEKSQKELNEDPEKIVTDVEIIRDWLFKQPHLQNVNPSDQWIVSFLRGNKFSLERTKEKLDMFYAVRTLVPEIFQDRDPLDTKINDVLKLGLHLPLPKCPTNGNRPMLMRFNFRDRLLPSIEDNMKVVFMIMEILINEDDSCIISGQEVIMDLKNCGVAVLSQWTPAVAKKVVTSFEKAFPIRLKYFHILNPPLGLETAVNLMKAFMSEKLKQRIWVYGENLDDFYKRFPQELLPKEYGGSNGTVQDLTDYWKAKVESARDWFLAEEKARSDETLRPEKPKTTTSLFGVEGSFRKLNVD